MTTENLLIPADNLRLPDAVTIKHGPSELLSRFLLRADRVARDKGIRLKLRTNWQALLELNQAEIARGNWYTLAQTFDCRQTQLTPENSFWIAGENEAGETVLCQGVRVYNWPNTSLAEEARTMFYGGQDFGQECEVTAATAKEISGHVYYGGSLWVRPDYRRIGLSHYISRIGRAYASSRWPVDWCIAMVKPDQIEKGICRGYGYTDYSYSISYPNSPLGDLELALIRMSGREILGDLDRFLVGSLAAAA